MPLPSRKFKRKEFACKCGCGFDTVDAELLDVLCCVREHFDAPVVIHSGCRCMDYNERIGGVANSQHLIGKAADIVVKGVDPPEVYRYLFNSHFNEYGLGNYYNFTHIDVRQAIARW